ncbi:MAG: hypothetical protein ACOH10_10400 [Rhodoglobus sp.]
MSRSVLVDRTALSLPVLQLWQPGKFYLPDGTFGPGETAQRRETTSSPMVRGRYASSIVEDQRMANVGVHVMSATEIGLQPLVMEVIAALTQFRYSLTWQWNGLSGTWACESADWALGLSGIIDEEWLAVDNQAVFFTVPHRRVSGL